MANMEQGFGMGVQGAQMGAQVGGPWGAVIGGIAGFALGSKIPDFAKIAMEKYNAEVVKNAARDLFDMRRVQNQENMRTAQALATYQDNRKVQMASINAQYGAADIIGSSANALKQTLDVQTNEAMNLTMLNAITGIENYNTRVDQMTNQRIASLQRTKGTAPMDAGQLVTQGVGLYKELNSQGSIGGAFKSGGNQIMGAFKNMWSGGGTTSTQGVNSGGLSGLFDSGKSSTLSIFNSSVMST